MVIQERDYLNNLDIDDDTQFESHTGFCKGKGTANSIVKLAKSNSIVLRQYKFISRMGN